VSVLTDVSWLYYNVVGALSVLIIGTVLSRMEPTPRSSSTA
jgi:hypothetical protein